MAAPRGDYTPRTGPLAGRTFRLRAGDAPTAPYNRYQQERARAMGFGGYNDERRQTASDIFRSLAHRMTAVRGIPYWRAQIAVNASGIARQSRSGYRKHNAIAWALGEGLYDTGDDAMDDIPY